MKIQLLLVTICSLTQAAYYSRLAHVNRLRSPAVFRPGVVLQRPWTHQRIMPAASHRAPYVVYRASLPHRYAVKHYNPNVRNVFPVGPLKMARLPPAPATEYEYIRAASPLPVVHSHGGTGAIHTIPAPNLSLSEKPIVVADSSEGRIETASEAPKTTYEVTEKYTEPIVYQAPNAPKVEAPTGFSKQSSLTTPEFQQFVRNGAAFHLPTQYGVTSLSLPQNHIIPQQFTMQGFTELSGHQDLLQTAAEGLVISPHALYQNDPNFLRKLQNQLLQQFQSVEFVPYPTDVQPQIQQTSPQPELFLLENEVITKQIPTSFKPREPYRNIVQRETQEGSVLSLIPQAFTPSNVTENFIDATTINKSQNVTLGIVTSETEPLTTTVKNFVETTTEEQKTTPIYNAQVGQNVGNVKVKEFHSAISDVRAAAALAQEEKLNESIHEENVTTTTSKSETDGDKSINSEKEGKNETYNEIKPIAGTPFEKPDGSVNVAYTLLRSQEDQTKVNKEGNVFAGQLVQAIISEDRDFNDGKVNTASRRPPLRLIAIPEKKMEIIPQKLTVVKAKIPSKSKLTFDDKTGEPILRIYASYSENPIQKEVLLSKLSNTKQFKNPVTRKQDNLENRKAATMKTFDKTITNDPNQVSQFGLKLRSRSDDYIPLFEEYEE